MAGRWDGGAPEALRWSYTLYTQPFQTHLPSGHAHRVLVFPTLSRLSSALDAIIALLMHSHMGDAWSPPACQHTLAAPTLLFVCARCLRDEALGQL